MDDSLRPKSDIEGQSLRLNEGNQISQPQSSRSTLVGDLPPFNMRWKVTESLQAHSEVLVSRLNFLIIDDIRATCEAIFELLKALGATSKNVMRCTSLAQATQRIQRERIDIVISDLYLMDGSGFDLLQLIRSTPEMSDMIFVLITSAPSEETLRKAKALTVSTVLAKPISFYDLQEHLLYCLLTQGVAPSRASGGFCAEAPQPPPHKLLARFSAISQGLTTRANSGFRKKGAK